MRHQIVLNPINYNHRPRSSPTALCDPFGTLLKQRQQPPDEHGKDYNHSTYCDLVISGLVGLRPRSDQIVEVNPMVPADWESFCLDRVPYHGRILTILWDKAGKRYGQGKGLRVFANGKLISSSPQLGRLTARLRE